jgi:hypothetical protein
MDNFKVISRLNVSPIVLWSSAILVPLLILTMGLFSRKTGFVLANRVSLDYETQVYHTISNTMIDCSDNGRFSRLRSSSSKALRSKRSQCNHSSSKCRQA